MPRSGADCNERAGAIGLFDTMGGTGGNGEASCARRKARPWLRLALAGLVLLALAAFYLCDLDRLVSLEGLSAYRHRLSLLVHAHPVGAGVLYFLVYVAAASLSLPALSVLTLAGGFLFGWKVAWPLVTVAATLGAGLLFLSARYLCGDAVRRHAGERLSQLADGFKRDAFHYLLVLRLAPVFPFSLVTIAPALFGMRFSSFLAATLIGILPGTLVYTLIGSGLGRVFREAALSGTVPTAADLLTPQVTLGLAGLALVALLPLAYRRYRRGSGAPDG